MSKRSLSMLKVIALTLLALTAFAANSVLCRFALGENAIDAGSFTAMRLLAGALTLWAILMLRTKGDRSPVKGGWLAGGMLFVYAVSFSYAYVTLDTATGALILFGAVQITMIILSLFLGHKLHLSEWVGASVAFGGFVYLVLPGIHTPSIRGFILMAIAGIAWGIYTLEGRDSTTPLRDTAYNFYRTIPFTLLFILLAIGLTNIQISFIGVVLAVFSGGVTSGIGYAIWYTALVDLSPTQAAVVQLAVPVLAALGGVVFLSEEIGLRLILSTLFVLGGILIVISGRYFFVLKGRNG